MSGVVRDIRFGLRALARAPSFTVVALVSLALAIGVNTAVFSLVNAILLRPAPVQAPAELVKIYTDDPENPGFLPLSHLNARALAELEDVITLAEGAAITADLELSREPEAPDARGDGRVQGYLISDNYLELLGVEPALGQLPRATGGGDEAPALLLGYDYWRALGGDSELVGQRAWLNGQPVTIAGVAPPRFNAARRGLSIDVYVPWSMAQVTLNDPRWLAQRRMLAFYVIARLAPGVSRARAEHELRARAAELAARYPEENAGRSVTLVPLARSRIDPNLRGSVVRAAVALMIVAGCILLIAIANVASLMLARASARQGEIAMRRVLGADSPRIVRQLLTESLLLAGLGGVGGVIAALWIRDLVWSLRPAGAFFDDVDISLDVSVALFTFALVALTGLLCGLAPALRVRRESLAATLRASTRGAAGLARRGPGLRARALLVVLQVALSLVALAGAGLVAHSLQKAELEGAALERQPVTLADVDARAARVRDADLRDAGARRAARARAIAHTRQALDAVARLPEVERAAITESAPLTGGAFMRTTYVDDGEGVLTDTTVVSPAYFEVMGIELARGRGFSDADALARPRVAIISEAMAAARWPGQDAVGQRMRFKLVEGEVEVVGVTRDAKWRSVTEEPAPLIYLPLGQWPVASYTLAIRGARAGAPLSAAITRAVEGDGEGAARDVFVHDVRPLAALVRRSLAPLRVGAALLAGLGALALLLAALGLYGLMTFSVRLRTRELGIRMALGADPRALLRGELVRGMQLVGLGVLLGLLVSFALGAWASSLLFEVDGHDPVAFVGAALTLGLAAAVAIYLPARRATRIDPTVALREE